MGEIKLFIDELIEDVRWLLKNRMKVNEIILYKPKDNTYDYDYIITSDLARVLMETNNIGERIDITEQVLYAIKFNDMDYIYNLLLGYIVELQEV